MKRVLGEAEKYRAIKMGVKGSLVVEEWMGYL
jgi:hypothetical protein